MKVKMKVQVGGKIASRDVKPEDILDLEDWHAANLIRYGLAEAVEPEPKVEAPEPPAAERETREAEAPEKRGPGRPRKNS